MEYKYLNLGCGNLFNKDWVNVDFNSRSKYVKRHDLSKGIPFKDNEFDAVYHSHVLEHFGKDTGKFFLSECFRVLKTGGIIRVVIPDLENIAREYLKNLEEILNGNPDYEKKYNWILLELYDQTLRESPGGEMQKKILEDDVFLKNYIAERVGSEFVSAGLNTMTFKNKLRNAIGKYTDGFLNFLFGKSFQYYQIGKFRCGGEIHQWMYDRYSLSKLLKDLGFKNIEVKDAFSSNIPNYDLYNFDLYKNQPRGKSSLILEACKL
jgi:predicted SAM-dependent methyltransferase